MSALPKVAIAPEPFAFTLRRGAGENWIVEGPCNGCGGLFVSHRAALDFIRRERQALEDLSCRRAYGVTR